MTADRLDHIIWTALTTQHADLAEGDALARRYPVDIAPFAAVREPSEAAWQALARLIAPGDQVALFTTAEVTPGGGLRAAPRDRDAFVDQMVLATDVAPPALVANVLGDGDAEDMRALVAITNPGPFRARTHQLGRFVGVRAGGQLVAMAGERMHLDGFTEISGVCVHPEHRGHGYAGDLVKIMCGLVIARGVTPMLHVFPSNHGAIALYHKLGFRLRATLHLASVEPIAG